MLNSTTAKKEEITGDDPISYKAAHFELRQRWLTDEGVAFLKAIILGLQKKENLWDSKRPEEEQPGLDFGAVTLPGGKRFADFYYVHETKDRNFRDLRWADSKDQALYRANLQGAVLRDANLQEAGHHQG